MRSSDAMAATARPATARQATKAAKAGSPAASAEKNPSRIERSKGFKGDPVVVFC